MAAWEGLPAGGGEVAATGYASLMLMAAKRSIAAAGWLREEEGRGSGERSLLPSLCARNINDKHFSPDTHTHTHTTGPKSTPRTLRNRATRWRRAGGLFSFSSRDFPPIDGASKTAD